MSPYLLYYCYFVTVVSICEASIFILVTQVTQVRFLLKLLRNKVRLPGKLHIIIN